MNQSELQALLGRPLTSTEVANRELYLDIARGSLEELLCMPIDCRNVVESRVFDIRDGYSTVFTDIFTEVDEVKVDGVATTEYHPAFWDKRSNAYYNSIVLDDCGGSTVEITATWGFDEVPSDLKQLIAQLFANVSKKYQPGADNVRRKAVEDFSVWYGELSDDEVFMNANRRTIQKYRMCDIGYVIHGDVCNTHKVRNCEYCI
jgi:hypothetical protein